LPKDLTYNLLQVQINGKVLRFIDGVTLDSDGRAICAGRKGTCSGKSPNSPIDLVFFAGKTEPNSPWWKSGYVRRKDGVIHRAAG
jgi:hypothetical protein